MKINSFLRDLNVHNDLIDKIYKRLWYSSFLLSNYNLLYIETPKCACSTMKNIMCYLDERKPPRKHVGKESSFAMAVHNRGVNPVKNLDFVEDVDDYLKKEEGVRFCIVRNPYARLASAWADKIRQREPGYKETWLKINNYVGKSEAELNSCPTFGEFVLWVVNSQDPDNCNIHWRAMHKLLYPDLVNYTHVLKTENLVSGFQEVLDAAGIENDASYLLERSRTNESIPLDWKSLYDEEIASLVYKHFLDDFVLYEYEKESWKNSITEFSCEKQLERYKKDYDKLYESSLEAIRNRNEVIEFLVSKQSFGRKDIVKRNVLVIGDSHAKVFEKDIIKNQTPRINWNVVSVVGATLSGLDNPNSKTQALPVFEWALSASRYESIVFQLGEVDLGFVIHYRSKFNNVDVDSAFNKALENYKNLILKAKKQAPVLVMSTCLPTISDDSTGDVANARKEIDIGQLERTRMTLLFNEKIREWCDNNGVLFINLDPFVIGGDGLINKKFIKKDKADHHYNSREFSKIIIDHLLPTLRQVLNKN